MSITSFQPAFRRQLSRPRISLEFLLTSWPQAYHFSGRLSDKRGFSHEKISLDLFPLHISHIGTCYCVTVVTACWRRKTRTAIARRDARSNLSDFFFNFSLPLFPLTERDGCYRRGSTTIFSLLSSILSTLQDDGKRSEPNHVSEDSPFLFLLPADNPFFLIFFSSFGPLRSSCIMYKENTLGFLDRNQKIPFTIILHNWMLL